MSEGAQYPFRIIHLDDEAQKRIINDFAGHPNGLVSANHWGFKLSATVTEHELQEAYQHLHWTPTTCGW